jgi:hypothetical protein
MHHVYRDVTIRECLEAALHIARKDPLCREVECTSEHIVFEKTVPVDPLISRTLKIPTSITFHEKWVFATGGSDDLAKFLVQANVSAGKFSVSVGSCYAATTDSGVAIQTLVKGTGLEAFPIMKPLFETYVKCEFTAKREREGRRIVRARVRASRGAAGIGDGGASTTSELPPPEAMVGDGDGDGQRCGPGADSAGAGADTAPSALASAV